VKVLLLGGSGQLGSEIRSRWTGDDVVAPAHSQLDLEDAVGLERALDRVGPSLLVNCAAFHNVDVCETESGRAFAVNALAVDAAAQHCAARDIAFLTISTDYVFDGDASLPYTEEDCARPISVYGASKLAGEELVLRRAMKAFVVRTCGVYGVHASKSKGTFIDRVVAQARAGETPRVVRDVIASPTYAGHLAIALREIVASGSYGLIHACNVGPVSWYDFASAALELAGVTHPIEAISASQWKAPARRPAFSALANDKLGQLGIVMPSWREGVAAYLHDS
jgi:dTDP-4-dehydrorhamnose reductase